MRSVIAACEPRNEILAGTFNPEMFKASLSRVIEDYAKGRAGEGADILYSEQIAFFRDATYATQGIQDVIGNALARPVSGDLSRPPMQRLDTAFGGGLGGFAFDDALQMSKSLNLALRSGNYRVDDHTVAYANARDAEAAAVFAKKGSRLRLLRPEERLPARLEHPQTLWDALGGLITNYRAGGVVAAATTWAPTTSATATLSAACSRSGPANAATTPSAARPC